MAWTKEQARAYSKKYWREHREELIEKSREQKAKYRAENKEKIREQGRKYAAAHQEERRKYAREWARKKRAENPEKENEYMRKWRAAHAEEIRERDRKYRVNNPEKKRAAELKWRAANPERVLATYRRRQARKYDLTVEERDAMFKKQKGCCAICHKHHTDTHQGLNIDHNHKTGQVRGLLCGQCNAGIGNLRDDVELLRSAIEYLQKF